jgi:hypothetical protein
MCFSTFQLYIKTETSNSTSDKAPVDMQDIEQRLFPFQMGIVRNSPTRLRN